MFDLINNEKSKKKIRQCNFALIQVFTSVGHNLKFEYMAQFLHTLQKVHNLHIYQIREYLLLLLIVELATLKKNNFVNYHLRVYIESA